MKRIIKIIIFSLVSLLFGNYCITQTGLIPIKRFHLNSTQRDMVYSAFSINDTSDVKFESLIIGYGAQWLYLSTKKNISLFMTENMNIALNEAYAQHLDADAEKFCTSKNREPYDIWGHNADERLYENIVPDTWNTDNINFYCAEIVDFKKNGSAVILIYRSDENPYHNEKEVDINNGLWYLRRGGFTPIMLIFDAIVIATAVFISVFGGKESLKKKDNTVNMY